VGLAPAVGGIGLCKVGGGRRESGLGGRGRWKYREVPVCCAWMEVLLAMREVSLHGGLAVKGCTLLSCGEWRRGSARVVVLFWTGKTSARRGDY
jgi:hypothetical protein